MIEVLINVLVPSCLHVKLSREQIIEAIEKCWDYYSTDEVREAMAQRMVLIKKQ